MKQHTSSKTFTRSRQHGSVQHVFCPREIDHDAICLQMAGRREYLAVLEVGGISARIRSEEECALLNEQFQQILLSLSYPLQVLLRVLPIDLEKYLASFCPPEHSCPLDTQKETWVQLADSHHAFMQQIAARQPLLERRVYLVISALSDTIAEQIERTFLRVFRPRAASQEAKVGQARQQLALRCQEMERQLNAISLSARRLSTNELMALVHACLQPQEAHDFPIQQSWIAGRDRLVTMQAPPSARPVISEGEHQPTPSLPGTLELSAQEADIRWPAIADLVAPASVEVFGQYLKIEQDYVQILDVHTLPRRVSPGWFHHLMRIDEVMDVSLFYVPQPHTSTMQALRRKRFELHSSALLDQEHNRYPDPDQVVAQADIEELMDRIAAGHDRVFAFAMHVCVRGTSFAQMQTRAQRLRLMLYSMQLGSRVAFFEQVQGLLSCLPYGNSQWRTNEYPLVLGSREASSTFPFLAHSLFEPDGILEGMLRTGEPIVVNWWSKERRNANRLLVGPSGSGKTFKVHVDLDRLFLRYGAVLFEEQQSQRLPFQCIIVDIEREFRRQTLERGGQWIRLAPGTQQCINPFDLPQMHRPQTHQYLEYSLADKIADLHALLDVMLAEHDTQGRGHLSNQEKALLDKALIRTYAHVGITDDPLTHSRIPPLLRDLYDIVRQEVCGPDPTGLADRLSRFVEGSLSGMFSGHTNVTLDAIYECFDIHDLPADLRPIAIFLLSSHVWNISFGSTIPIVFVVDELASLFQYEEGRRFLESLFQRARKHHLSVIGVTQYVGILADSSIPTNCGTTIVMAQEAASLGQIQQIFHLSDAEVAQLRTFGKGEALLLLNDQRFAVRFEASESEYAIATSDPRDLTIMKKGNVV